MLRYMPADLDLGRAIDLLIGGYGATKADAEAFLLEWIKTGALELRHPPPPDGARVVALQQLDLIESKATFLVRYPAVRMDPNPHVPADWTLKTFPWVAAVSVSRTVLQALATEASVLRPAPLSVAALPEIAPVSQRSDGPVRRVVPEKKLRGYLEAIISEQVRAGDVQPRDEMLARAREDLGNIDRGMFRKLRRELLPPEFARPGPKRRSSGT